MKKFVKPGLIILISVFLGCETANDVGVKNPFGGNLTVKYEELSLPASNIYIDSLRTDGEGKILAGSYTDPLTGRVTAEGYFQYYFDEGTFPGDSLSFEGISAQFKINSKIGSTSSENIQILQGIDTLRSSLVYLRSNKEELSSFPLADVNTSINGETIALDLKTEYGQLIFGAAQDGNSAFSIPSAGGDYVSPTLAFRMNSTASLIDIDLEDDNSWFKLFMTGSKVDTVYELKFKFSSGTVSTEYSNIERTREGTEFANIVENSDFQLSTGETIIDPLTGISTAIDISSLSDFFVENGNITINSAAFSFEFKGESDRDTLENSALYFRKNDLSFFGPASELNQFNNIIATDNSYAIPVLSGSLNFIPSLSYLNQDEDQLILDATNFLRNVYSSSQDSTDLYFETPFADNPRLLTNLILISSENISLERTIFKNSGIKLKIYYTESN